MNSKESILRAIIPIILTVTGLILLFTAYFLLMNADAVPDDVGGFANATAGMRSLVLFFSGIITFIADFIMLIINLFISITHKK